MSIEDSKRRPTSAVERYAGTDRGETDATNPEHVGAFYRREREVKGPALSLSLKLKNGNRKTVEYAHRTEMDFDPETGIEMFFTTGVKITIKGKHLEQLYEDLALHKVIEIRSLDQLHAFKEVKSDVTGKALPVVLDVIVERGRIDVDTGLWQPSPGQWDTSRQSWIPNRVLN